MNIGVCVQHKKGTDFDIEFKRLTDNGFNHCQLISWEPKLWTDMEAKKIESAVKSTALQ